MAVSLPLGQGRDRAELREMILDLAKLVEHLVHGVAPDPRAAMQSPGAPVIRFENAARLHTAMNPDFFKGTVVEGAVAQLLA